MSLSQPGYFGLAVQILSVAGGGCSASPAHFGLVGFLAQKASFCCSCVGACGAFCAGGAFCGGGVFLAGGAFCAGGVSFFGGGAFLAGGVFFGGGAFLGGGAFFLTTGAFFRGGAVFFEGAFFFTTGAFFRGGGAAFFCAGADLSWVPPDDPRFLSSSVLLRCARRMIRLICGLKRRSGLGP
ncbi:MAG TPA: hypothetical protein VMW68_00885 [Methyloceanibacter sp.]|nr:hypothetical protein [Methyloceanibacter sp.]